MIIPCRNNVSIIEKSAVRFGADWDRGGALFLGTSNFSVSTTRVNSGVLAGVQKEKWPRIELPHDPNQLQSRQHFSQQ